MEFKVISLKTTTLHSGVVEKNKFISIMKNGYKGWQPSFISISTLNITKILECKKVTNLFLSFFQHTFVIYLKIHYPYSDIYNRYVIPREFVYLME